jgi:hypothetical protein
MWALLAVLGFKSAAKEVYANEYPETDSFLAAPKGWAGSAV